MILFEPPMEGRICAPSTGGKCTHTEGQVMNMALGELVTEQAWTSVEETRCLPPMRVRTAGRLLDRIGGGQLCLIIWRSTPFPLRLISFVYGLTVYRKLLATSTSVGELYTLHVERYESSRLFRLFRPRYHTVRGLLDSLRVEERAPVK